MMGKRIVAGVMLIGLMAGGVYFANLSRESQSALYAARAKLEARDASLRQEQEARMRVEKHVALFEADLKNEQKVAAKLKEASKRNENNILKLRESISYLKTQASERVRLLKKTNEELTAKLRETGKSVQQAKEKIRTLEMAKEGLSNQLANTAAALEHERALAARLEKAVAGKNAQASKVRQALVMAKASLNEMGEKHQETRVWAQKESLRAKKLEASVEELRQKVSNRELLLRQTKDMLQIDIVNRVLFDVGSARIKKNGRRTLGKLVDFLKAQSDKAIQVEGHTDNQRISGSLARRYPTNWELSSARAISVVRYLESKGVPPERLSAIGYSFYREEASNDTAEGRARNRRIVLSLSRQKR
jgi:chemotaxis protein MotB